MYKNWCSVVFLQILTKTPQLGYFFSNVSGIQLTFHCFENHYIITNHCITGQLLLYSLVAKIIINQVHQIFVYFTVTSPAIGGYNSEDLFNKTTF